MDMKSIVSRLADNKIVCSSLITIDPSELGSRKRVTILQGVDIEGYYCAVFVPVKKSRLLSRDAADMIELKRKLENLKGFSIRKVYLLAVLDICSKAKALLEHNGWVVFETSKA